MRRKRRLFRGRSRFSFSATWFWYVLLMKIYYSSDNIILDFLKFQIGLDSPNVNGNFLCTIRNCLNKLSQELPNELRLRTLGKTIKWGMINPLTTNAPIVQKPATRLSKATDRFLDPRKLEKIWKILEQGGNNGTLGILGIICKIPKLSAHRV